MEEAGTGIRMRFGPGVSDSAIERPAQPAAAPPRRRWRLVGALAAAALLLLAAGAGGCCCTETYAHVR